MQEKTIAASVASVFESDHAHHASTWHGTDDASQSLESLRKRQAAAHRDFQVMQDRIVDALAKGNPIAAAAPTFNTVGGAALARASRRIGQDVKERRELAKMLLIGALLNHDNPDWNPADASTDRANHDDPFVALLKMNLTATK